MKFVFISLCLFLLSSKLLAKNEKVISKIPEASGIVYSTKSDTLFVANDEGSIYEITKKGKLLRKKKIGKYDLEALAIDNEKQLLLAINEKNETILILDIDTLELIQKIKIKRAFNNIKLLKKGGDGIEGLALHNGKIYASNQSKKKYPKEDSSVIVILDYDLSKRKLKIKDIIDHGFIDIAGLTFYKNFMYMVSDKKNLLIKYDIQNKKLVKKYKLSKKYDQEGIAFDTKGKVYIADDKGRILKVNLDK